MALVFEKDVLGRYMVRRDDGLFIVPPTYDKTQVLPQLINYLGAEVNQADVANQLASLDNIGGQCQVDSGNSLVQESNPGTVSCIDTLLSSDDADSNN